MPKSKKQKQEEAVERKLRNSLPKAQRWLEQARELLVKNPNCDYAHQRVVDATMSLEKIIKETHRVDKTSRLKQEVDEAVDKTPHPSMPAKAFDIRFYSIKHPLDLLDLSCANKTQNNAGT